MPTGDFRCPSCQQYNCMDKERCTRKWIGDSYPGLGQLQSPPNYLYNKFDITNLKDLEFLSWADVGYVLFDQFKETFKIHAYITLQPHLPLSPKFMFAKIDTDTIQTTSTDGTGETWEFHISSPVWIFEGISYYYKTLEEAKEAIRSESKKFVEAFFK